MIKTTGYDQSEIIDNIIKLHCKNGIDADVTFSKGNFYKNKKRPDFTSDFFPQDELTIKADAAELPVENENFNSIMFDPPFLAGGPQKASGVMQNRFGAFRYVPDLWQWYSKCMIEFNRVLKKNGVLIIKCQDTVSQCKNHFSHIHIYNEAIKNGFYCVDMFILLAKSRPIGRNHANQQHARKFHCYFMVFRKAKK